MHIARHEITAAEVEQVLRNGPLEVEQQLRGGERRILCLGQSDAGRLLTVVYTVREGKIRVVTAHPMNRRQRRFHESRQGA